MATLLIGTVDQNAPTPSATAAASTTEKPAQKDKLSKAELMLIKALQGKGQNIKLPTISEKRTYHKCERIANLAKRLLVETHKIHPAEVAIASDVLCNMANVSPRDKAGSSYSLSFDDAQNSADVPASWLWSVVNKVAHPPVPVSTMDALTSKSPKPFRDSFTYCTGIDFLIYCCERSRSQILYRRKTPISIISIVVYIKAWTSARHSRKR